MFMLENKLRDDTMIDAGHYSATTGPSELDLHLWRLGVQLFSYAKGKYKNIGLMLLVDDMMGMSTEERKKIDISRLPESYLQVLNEFHISPKDVTVLSQHKIKEKGRQTLRRKGLSRSSVSACELVVATCVDWRKAKGYTNAVCLYEESKTAGGVDMQVGTERAKKLFGKIIETHYLIFRNREKYKYLKFANS